MCKKIISHLLIFSFLLSGCYSWEIVQEPELNSELRITTKNNEQYEFKSWKQNEDYIYGITDDVEEVNSDDLQIRINKADIDQVEVKYLDGLNTTLFICGSAVVVTFAAYGMYYVSDKVKAVMEW